MTAPRAFDVHVIPHTHWDREWYLPAGRFRQRLVELVDELLEEDEGRERGVFLLDGQAIILADYLDVRSDRRNVLSQRLANRELEAGPWYVLADELIPSGEALVRNLLAGRRALREVGAEPPPVLYSPDAFGHPAALPSIAAGFGMNVCILWRGLGGERWPRADTFRWVGRDGASVLVHHLPGSGYDFGAGIPADPNELESWWETRRRTLSSRARTGVLLVLNGADHHARQRGLDQAMAALARLAAPDRLRRSSLRDFAAALVRAAASSDVPAITGELRDSTGHTWSLQGTLGARTPLKRANAVAERLLSRDSEPWASLAQLRSGRNRAPHLRAAWRRLLECHPHDTLCGCSSDEVARAMAARTEDVVAQARGIREDSLLGLLNHDREAARTSAGSWRPIAVVRNRAARTRRGVAEVELLRFVRDVPVGPGSASAPRREEIAGDVTFTDSGIAFQHLGRSFRHDRIESSRHYPDDDLVESRLVAAWVEAVPGYGVTTLPLARTDVEPHKGGRLPADVTPVMSGAEWIDNGLVRVERNRDGALILRRARSDAPPVRLRFEDVGDAGDLYTHSPVGPAVLEHRCQLRRRHGAGELLATLVASYVLRVPRLSSREGRSALTTALPVQVRVAVRAGEPFARVSVRGYNAARDHRLRLLLEASMPGEDSIADAAFGNVRRRRAAPPPHPTERPVATAPLARHVTIAADRHRLTVLSDGLAEYEATESGTIAVTLLRAVGELSRDDLPERPGHAGWPVSTPQAQLPGPFSARLGVMIFPDQEASAAVVERAAEDFLLPLIGGTLRSATSHYEGFAGVELTGDGLAFSCCKPAEDDGRIVLRCVNLLNRPVRGAWRLAAPVTEAVLARLDETPLRSLPVRDRVIAFDADAGSVVTILIR